MEWEKAKTILIIVFLLLNAGLFIMGAAISDNGKMSRGEAQAVTELLTKNGITLTGEIPGQSKPHRLMTLTAAEWDYAYIKSTFFPDEQNVTRINEEGNVIYSAESGVNVTIVNAGSNDPELIYYEPEGTKTAAEYIAQLGKRFERFELKRVTTDENEIHLYSETLKNNVVFSSEVTVTFLSGGGALVNIRKYDFDSYVEGLHDIFRADEALMTLIHYKNENIPENVVVEDIQLGYVIDAQTPEKTRKAKPCYRIFISGRNEPVFIDALMNTVL